MRWRVRVAVDAPLRVGPLRVRMRGCLCAQMRACVWRVCGCVCVCAHVRAFVMCVCARVCLCLFMCVAGCLWLCSFDARLDALKPCSRKHRVSSRKGARKQARKQQFQKLPRRDFLTSIISWPCTCDQNKIKSLSAGRDEELWAQPQPDFCCSQSESCGGPKVFLTLIFSRFHLGMCSFDAVCSRRVHSFMALGLLLSNVMLVSCANMNDAERSRRRHEGLSKSP